MTLQFHEYKSLYQNRRQYFPEDKCKLDSQAFYEMVTRNANKKVKNGFHGMTFDEVFSSKTIFTTIGSEESWYRKSRPYYKVWPGIADALFRINLNCSAPALNLPLKTVLLRFAIGKEPLMGKVKVATVLVSHQKGDILPHWDAL